MKTAMRNSLFLRGWGRQALLLFSCAMAFLLALGHLHSQPWAAEPRATGPDTGQLGKLLTDSRLWGEDAFALFGSLDRWQKVGETSICIYPDRVVGASRFATAESAKPSVTRMMAEMSRARLKLRPEFAERYGAAFAARAPGFKVQSTRLLEDDSFHLIWQREGGQFLKKDLPIRVVFEAYGKPEKTTTEVMHAQGDRRPAVLTVHHYANGAIKFVESDLAPTPGLVDRVILDVTAAATRIFSSPR